MLLNDITKRIFLRKMTAKCCVPSCPNVFVKDGSKTPRITFHTFPGGPSVRREWLHRIGLSQKTAISQLLICSKHFHEEQLMRRNGSITLKPDALPLLELTENQSENVDNSCHVRVIHKRPLNYRAPISKCILPLTSRVCCVRTCKRRLRRGRLFKFYRFPSDRFIRSLWVIASPKHIFSNTTEAAIICSAHFTSDSFVSDMSRWSWLRDDASPFIFNEDYVSPKSVLRRINQTSDATETNPKSVSPAKSKLSQLLRAPVTKSVKFVCDSKLVPATSYSASLPAAKSSKKPSSSNGENHKFYLRSKYYRYLGDIKDSDLKSPFGAAKAIELVQKDAERKYSQYVDIRRKNKRIAKKIRGLKQLMIDFKEAEELAVRYPSIIF